MKRFISTKHMDESVGTNDIIRAFGDKFGFLPSSTTVRKYGNYNETNPILEEEEEEEEGGEGGIGVIVKDSRLEKDFVSFTGDGMEEADFERLCRNMNKPKHVMYDQIQEAIKRGYTKVNITTGDIEK